MSNKKEKAFFDSNGKWVEQRGRVKGAIRRVFRLFPQVAIVKNAARVELPPATKKDGTPGARPQVRYRCAMCNGLFSSKYVQVDHKEAVVPLWKREVDMSYDEMVDRICSPIDNLQVLCSTPIKLSNGNPSCHKIKTDQENWTRDYLNSFRAKGLLEDEIKLKLPEAEQKYKLSVIEKQELKRLKEEKKKIRLQKRGLK